MDWGYSRRAFQYHPKHSHLLVPRGEGASAVSRVVIAVCEAYPLNSEYHQVLEASVGVYPRAEITGRAASEPQRRNPNRDAAQPSLALRPVRTVLYEARGEGWG
jgi:hypothetical protein